MAESIALISRAHELGHRELERIAQGLETVLSNRRISREQPIAFVARPELSEVTFAIALLRLRRPIAPLHARWTSGEIRDALETIAPASFFAPGEIVAALDAARGEAPSPPPVVSDHDASAIVFTSGSEEAPKPVVLSHRAFIASAQASAANLGWKEADRWLLALPFAHVGGISVLTRSAAAKKPVVLSQSEPEAVLDAIARHRVTLLSVVPAQLRRLMEADVENRLSRLRAVLVGGSEFTIDLRCEAASRKIAALASYGLTETCAQVATQRLAEARDPASSDCGRPLDGVELRIARDGRIQVRGPMLMSGYLGAPPLELGAFFSTGDLGAIDERGRLHVYGRADDVIVTGGENVQPAEIERTCRAHPGVVAALAFGVPDPTWGEMIALALVLDSPPELGALRQRFDRELAPFKRPRRVAFVAELPLGPSGKPDRRRARSELGTRLLPI